MAGEWRRATVKELQQDKVLLVEDGNHGEYRPRPEEFVDAGVAFIRAADMDAGRVRFESASKINERARQRITKGIGAPGDVLLSHKGTVGKVALVPDTAPPFVCSPQTTFWRTLDPRRLDRKFLHAFLRSPEFHAQLATRAGETDMAPYVSLTSQRGLSVTLPPIGAQRAIAHILGTLDDKIELNRRMNETLEAIARALFKSWFVDFDPVRAKAERRATGLPDYIADLFPDSFEDSELGQIPKGWTVTNLQEVLSELETGGRPKGGVAKYTTGVPSIGAESIVGLGLFDYTKTKYVPQEYFDKMPKGRMKSRDVLLYKDGGRPGVFEPHVTLFGDGFPFATCAINEHVYRMRAVPKLGQNFLLFWISSNFAMEEMRIKGTGVAIPGLNSTQVKSLTTLVPPPTIVRGFDSVVEPWITRILASCNETHTLSIIRDRLLPKLISGEIRVRDAENYVAAKPSWGGDRA
jgi:type I restriction enzyme S subunit